MESVLDWGIGIIEIVQTLSRPWLDALMRGLTLLGDELFYLALMPILFWCVDERRAFRLGMALFLSSFLNAWIKGLFRIDRPFLRKDGLGIGYADGYSLPSGHAQISATFWGGLGLLWKGRITLVLAFLLPALIGFTRIYLGVHYPTDVVAGWLLGALPVLAWAVWGPRIEAFLPKLNVRLRIALVAALAWLMCLLHRADVAAAAGFFGTGLGWILNRERIRAGTDGNFLKKAARVVIGGAVLAAIYLGLKAVLPGSETPSGPLFRFLRYGILGFWVSAGAPWLFLRLKLTETRPKG